MTQTRVSQMVTLSEPLRVLTPRQITQIDRYLADIEDFGRITLIKRRGKLRFIEKTESRDVVYSDS